MPGVYLNLEFSRLSFQMQMILALSRESDPSWSLIKLGFISSLKPMKKSEKESDKKIDLLSI